MSDQQQRLTTEELGVIEARALGASPGPWVSRDVSEESDRDCGEWIVQLGPGDREATVDRLYFGDMETNTGRDIRNADFVAASREDVPRLVEEVRTVRAERDAMVFTCAEFEERHAALVVAGRKVVAELEAAKEALRLADEALDLMDYRGKRAQYFPPGSAPEDAAVRELGKRHGYGAVMDSCARWWWMEDEGRGGSYIVGGCAATVEKAAKAVKRALDALAAGQPARDGRGQPS